MNIALSMIVKNEVEQVDKILKLVDPYITTAYITITSKEREKDFYKIQNDKVEWSYFEWCEDFAKARNFNLKQIESDVWFWVDSDDTIENVEELPKLAQALWNSGIDGIYLPYNYMQNEQGECIAIHDRERILRTSHPFKWKGAIHESLISEGVPQLDKTDTMVIRHNKSIDEVPESAERNHKILLKEYKKHKDPRITHYLGLSYFMQRKYDKSIEKLLEHIKESGWDEEKYRSWCKIAEAHIITENYDKAHAAANAAITLLPDYQEAYYIKCLICSEQGQHYNLIEWYKNAKSHEQPETMSIIDPTYESRTMVEVANAYIQLGMPKEAFYTIREIQEKFPLNDFVKRMYPIFEYGYLESKAIEYIQYIDKFYKEAKGDREKLLKSLPPSVFSDPRLNDIRNEVIPPKKWPEKSIVFYCGNTLEVWGADTLDKGMGGSEEAIVYLSRELAKLGWEVTIFNERDEEYREDYGNGRDNKDGFYKSDGTSSKPYAVTYKPWTEINPFDTFDVFVAWRAPELAKGVKARKKIVDLHDTVEAKRIEAADYVDMFLVKSKYHKSLYNVDNIKVISNGIKEEYEDLTDK